jgi:hypothetical protein
LPSGADVRDFDRLVGEQRVEAQRRLVLKSIDVDRDLAARGDGCRCAVAGALGGELSTPGEKGFNPGQLEDASGCPADQLRWPAQYLP